LFRFFISGADFLLDYVYKKHPPKVPSYTKGEELDKTGTSKKRLMKAILFYHPDKQVLFGMEWKVLCEEITKYLNFNYETCK
jgi:hypothetical protein